MKIYFAAHSTTTDNEENLSSGWKDARLSELGIRQSKEMGERFKDIKIDLICCSDLKRAVDTVKIAFGDKYPIIVDKRLRELNYGDFNGKLSKIVEAMKKEHIKKPFPNGESYEQAMIRVHDFLSEITEKYPNKTILIVGHRATQYGLDTLVGKTLKECLERPFKWQPYWEYELQKIMGFHESVVPEVLDGKISTWRLRDHKLKVGDIVAFENSQTGEIFGYGEITEVAETTVGKIDLKDKKHYKTYENRQKLIKAFKRYNPAYEVNNDTPVFVYTYKFKKKI
jgi:broad specificity phosphatase PhoE